MEATHTHKATGNKLQFIEYVGKSGIELKDSNGIILEYEETEVEPIYTTSWFVEIYMPNRHTNKLSLLDIPETPYQTKEEAEAAAQEMRKEQDEDNKHLEEEYATKLEAFIFDETTDDSPPRLYQIKNVFKVNQHTYSKYGGFRDQEVLQE